MKTESNTLDIRMDFYNMLNSVVSSINKVGQFYLDYRVHENTIYLTEGDYIIAMFMFCFDDFYCYSFDSDYILSEIDNDYHVDFLLDVLNTFKNIK